MAETPLEKVNRIRAGGTRTVIEQPSLPTRLDDLLVTMDLVQLHDLVYAASSLYLQKLSGMPKAKAQHHAARVAIQAELLVQQTDYLHRGGDPRE